MTLEEFLLARIAEDEAVAFDCKVLVPMGYSWRTISWLHGANREHGRRWDPVRVLAECEAKRQIVYRCRLLLDSWELTHPPPGGATLDVIPAYPDVNRREKSHAYATLADLAMIYADHSDFDENWRT